MTPAAQSHLDAQQMARVIRRMAVQLVEQMAPLDDLMLVGIRTRGLPLAERLAAEIETAEGVRVPIGVLDITLYRDDVSESGPQAVVRDTRLPGAVEGKVLVLCDDVLYTGRTIRAALDALIDYGRPRAVRLAVLIDRGHRELPIQADVVGRETQTRADQQVHVKFLATDGEDGVEIDP